MGPNFFIIGAPKCGTTSLAELLGQHPNVYFCPEKEPRFFSHESLYERGFDYYESLFDGAEGQKRIGEGSTTYSEAWVDRDKKSARRIHEYCPSAHIIYCVRHPLRRIESHYLDIVWALDNGLIPRSEVDRRGLCISGAFNKDILHNIPIVKTSNYFRRVKNYNNYFDKGEIQVIFLEELKRDPIYVLKTCCEFLGIDPTFAFEDPDEARNTSASKGLATTFGHLVRSIPGYQALAGGAPQFLKSLVRPLIKDSFTEKPEWDPAVKEKVINRIGDETKKFLQYTGRPRDYWTLQE